MHAQGLTGEPQGLAPKPSQAKPDPPDLELAYHVSLSQRISKESFALNSASLNQTKISQYKEAGKTLPFAYSRHHECSLGVA